MKEKEPDNFQASTKLLYWGFMISFLGSLPPGIITIAAIQISARKGMDAGFGYAIGSMLAEIIIVRLALTGINKIVRNGKLLRLLEWLTAVMLITFSAYCFNNIGMNKQFPLVIPEIMLSAFFTGAVLSILSPMHIPFWVGWGTVLMKKGILKPKAIHYNTFIAGVGLGTLAGFVIYIFGGNYLVESFQSNQFWINIVVGMLLLLIAFFHIRRMILVPVNEIKL